jgi:hypothetical protein
MGVGHVELEGQDVCWIKVDQIIETPDIPGSGEQTITRGKYSL